MKSKASWITVLIAVFALFIAATNTKEQQKPRAWEYRVTLSNVSSPAELNQAGADGWEFVVAVPSNNGNQTWLYFKRPK